MWDKINSHAITKGIPIRVLKLEAGAEQPASSWILRRWHMARRNGPQYSKSRSIQHRHRSFSRTLEPCHEGMWCLGDRRTWQSAPYWWFQREPGLSTFHPARSLEPIPGNGSAHCWNPSVGRLAPSMLSQSPIWRAHKCRSPRWRRLSSSLLTSLFHTERRLQYLIASA